MENSILRSKQFLPYMIIKSVTLLTKRISHKDATLGTIIKFVVRGEISGIHKQPPLEGGNKMVVLCKIS